MRIAMVFIKPVTSMFPPICILATGHFCPTAEHLPLWVIQHVPKDASKAVPQLSAPQPPLRWNRAIIDVGDQTLVLFSVPLVLLLCFLEIE